MAISRGRPGLWHFVVRLRAPHRTATGHWRRRSRLTLRAADVRVATIAAAAGRCAAVHCAAVRWAAVLARRLAAAHNLFVQCAGTVRCTGRCSPLRKSRGVRGRRRHDGRWQVDTVSWPMATWRESLARNDTSNTNSNHKWNAKTCTPYFGPIQSSLWGILSELELDFC